MSSFKLGGVLLAAAAIAACSRDKAVPDPTTTAAETRNQPVDVSGCLRAGDADSTFVLIASSETPSADAATTYQLNGSERLGLRNYVGHQVEVIGTMRAETQVVSDSGKTPQQPAQGTSGTPGVETKTNIDVRQVNVDSVKTLAERCAAE